MSAGESAQAQLCFREEPTGSMLLAKDWCFGLQVQLRTDEGCGVSLGLRFKDVQGVGACVKMMSARARTPVEACSSQLSQPGDLNRNVRDQAAVEVDE